MRRVLYLLAFAAVAGGVAACALVSGINGFAEVGLDASATTVTKPDDARTDAPSVTSTDDSPSEDDTSEEPPLGDDADDEGDASDSAAGDEAMADAPTGADVDAGAAPEDASDAAPPPPPTDAGDGGSPLDAGDGGCSVPTTHANGLGQFFTDCVPLGTYNAAQAAKACAAAGAGTCSPNTALCGNADMECTTMANTCMCWTYAGTTSGRARASGAGIVCQCPTTTDPLWN